MQGKGKFNKKLLVEGKDDQHVVLALGKKFSLTENFDVIDCEGIDKLLEQIPIWLKQSGIETIGIIVDADLDISDRWRALSALLVAIGYEVPVDIPKTGLITSYKALTIGIWVMPDNSVHGMLEDFIKFLVPDGDKLLEIANTSLNKIEEEKLNKYNIIHKSKALIHTWLSWQESPGTPMGLSITKRYLTTDTQLCNTFIDWLKELFS